MNKKKTTCNNNDGSTLVELIFALVAFSIVSLGVYFFVYSAGIMNKRLIIEQQLQQESAIVSEIFIRTIRNAKFVTVGADTVPPSQTEIGKTDITAHFDNDSTIEFVVDGNKLKMNGSRILTPYLGDYASPSSFTVYAGGTKVDFNLSIQKSSNGKSFLYTSVLGGVKCKNTR